MPDSQKSVKWTDAELDVLEECSSESFWFRSLPISLAMAGGVYFAVKQGYLKPNKRFGPLPKMLLATTAGHFIGQFSYASTCIDKFMRLPNSPFADELRKHQHGHGSKPKD